ncbi:hypothetical protein ABT160_42885 [Streptomyces sp. NPDC001941]|uniref:hypothetical protein n=1 Tax=Streptomyces sp. NPDC001941 TaxID=3154659 RepID=UPI0033274F4D
MISEQDLRTEIMRAVAEQKPLILRPDVFEWVQPSQGEFPEQEFLASNVVIAIDGWDAEEEKLTGTSTLAGVGPAGGTVPVEVTFGADRAGYVSGINFHIPQVTGMDRYPAPLRLAEAHPTPATVAVSGLRVECALLKSAANNSSVFSVTVTVAALGVKLAGRLTATAGRNFAYTDKASLSTREVDPPENVSVTTAGLLTWLGAPPTTVVPALSDLRGTELALTFSSQMTLLSARLTGQTTLYGQSGMCTVSVSGSAAGTGPARPWTSNGTFRLTLPDAPDTSLYFTFTDSGESSPSRVLALSADTTQSIKPLTLAGITDLPYMSELPDITDVLPEDLRAVLDAVTVTNVATVIDCTSGKPNVLGATISTNKPWKVFDGLFTLQDLRLWWTAGLSTQSPLVGIGIDATCLIADSIALQAKATLQPSPRIEVTVSQAQSLEGFDANGSGLPLPEFDDDLVPVDSDGGTRIGLRDLTAVCDLRNGLYRMDLALDCTLKATSWFEITEVRVGVDHSPQATRYTISGLADLAGAQARLSVAKDASGWRFSGGLALPEDTSFSQWVAEQFDYTLPEAVSGINPREITLDYRPSDKQLRITAAGLFDVADAACQFRLNLTHDGKNQKINATGEILVYTPDDEIFAAVPALAAPGAPQPA